MIYAYGKELKGTGSKLLNNILRQIDKTNAEGWRTFMIYSTNANSQQMEFICEWFDDLSFTVDRLDGYTVILGW